MSHRAAPVVLAVAVALRTITPAADPPEHPRDLGLVERASTRLAQLDVTVTGAKGTIEQLTAADFTVRLNHELVPNVVVDNLCGSLPASSSSPVPGAPASGLEKAGGVDRRATTATYLLYLDMAHLTQSGRQGSIATAREMLPKLLAGGDRAMIVVNADALSTAATLTSDVARLDSALVRLIDDRTTYDPYAASEESRRSDIVRELAHGVDVAIGLARRYAADERWRQERDLRRLSMVLGRFAEMEPPKAVLYFSDTMRRNAGEHYLSFFGGTALLAGKEIPRAEAAAIAADAATGALPLDRVIDEAAALGIRFYTIEGQGMTGENSPIQSQSSVSNSGGGGGGTIALWNGEDFGLVGTSTGDRSGQNEAAPLANSQHVRDAQGTLVSLAAETGGRAFLNGVAPARIAAQIVGDFSCLYLVSFDPAGFPQDKPLAVTLTTKRPGIKTVVRGRLVIQSESARVTSRVLSAFAAPTAQAQTNGAGVSVGLIPISFENGRFKARVQIVVSGSAVPSTTWDLGASVVSQGAVRQDGSGRIQVALPNTPVIYEQDMEFAPGDYDLVAVAHEVQTDTMLSVETHGSWPKIDAALASLGPIAVSQRRAGGFLRNGQKQTQGAVVVAEDDPLRADAPIAVIALVCRAGDQKRPLKVVRTLVGEGETPVGTTALTASSDRCAQVVDMVPPKTLGAGRYRYVIVVSSDGTELARQERALVVPEPPVVRKES